MNEPPKRVRVTRPTQPRARHTTVASEIDAQSEVGMVYMHSLIRAQLRLGLATLAALLLTIGLLPWLFARWPAFRHAHLAGLPLPWLILGVGAYPVVWLLALNYVRRAEHNEARFRDLVSPGVDDDLGDEP